MKSDAINANFDLIYSDEEIEGHVRDIAKSGRLMDGIPQDGAHVRGCRAETENRWIKKFHLEHTDEPFKDQSRCIHFNRTKTTTRSVQYRIQVSNFMKITSFGFQLL